jgi:nicotinamidase-related amidase
MLNRAADSLLMLVDIQERLVAAMTDTDRQRVLRASGIVLQAAVALDIPIVVTRQYPQGLGHTHPELQALLPADVPVFDKTSFSCCGADGMLATLSASRRLQVVLVGMETHVCVLQTAAELQVQGLEVFVAEDAVCSRAESHRQNALARMRQHGISVTNVESVVFEWLKDASHEKFKALSKLVR